MEGLKAELNQVASAYQVLCETVPLRVIRTEAEYDQAVETLNALLDAGGADEDHPLAELTAALGLFIEAYEAQHHPIPDAEPREVLRYLMQEHDLTQSDLPELGSQGVVSELLSGGRLLNARQIALLAKRFQVSGDAFLPNPER